MRLAIVLTFLLVAVTGALGQETATSVQPEPSPTPKPAVKRRTFDQFDLSNGVGSRLGSNSGSASSAATVTEYVDRQTYDGIVRMVEYAARMESEYRSTDGVAVDPSHYYAPYNTLSRKLPALFRISEIYNAGLLDQPALKNPANTALIIQSQEVIVEMMTITNSTEEQLARNQPKLLPIAERYSAPTNPVEKRPLLTAMFVRLNGNLARLKNQIAAKK